MSLREWANKNNCLHVNCNHKIKYIEQLINHKKKYNGNLNLYQNNKYLNSIIMKKELEIN